MKIEESKVTKLRITEVENLDPISVILEDFQPMHGKITIECHGECWSHYWVAMGEGAKIDTFFCRASNCYLAGKLATGLDSTIPDVDKLVEGCKIEILKNRRETNITKHTARELYEKVEWIDDSDTIETNSEIFYEVFGEEWWYAIPQMPNPKYEYLCRIIDTVKDALKQWKGGEE